MTDTFNVVQFFADDTAEYVRRNVGPKEAVEAAKHHTESLAAQFGAVRRVIITDDGDCTNFEWKYGEGITFGGPETPPSEEQSK